MRYGHGGGRRIAVLGDDQVRLPGARVRPVAIRTMCAIVFTVIRCPATPLDEVANCAALSAPRTSTYVAATGGGTGRAVALYGWNARISAALMLPAHFAEVTTRNAVSEALTALYGARWPWDATFQRSLPSPAGQAFNPRRNLLDIGRGEPTTGKVIAELKFAFWQSMFTARHDVRVWDHQILTLFPNAAGPTPRQLRGRINGDLETIRQLRNRIAHHDADLQPPTHR